MTQFLRKTLTAGAIAVALAAGSVGAAENPHHTAPVMHPAHPAAAEAAPKVDQAAIDAKFKGNKKAEYSYMVGMDIGERLQGIKDEIDIKIVSEALEASGSGGKTKLTKDESLAVRQQFVQHLRAKQEAKMKSEAEKNQKEGDAFLAKNKTKKGVKVTASGLQYEVIKQGNGPKPSKTDTVTVDYTGTTIDGTKFDSSIDRGQPVKFPLTNVIPGWTEAFQLMPVGSEYKLYIPAKLAYGERGQGSIGPDATLIFDVKLISIDKPAAAAPKAEPTKK
ncbi:MAG TPA: FKBP-type peptidyl-prolyl cis-trans isomerase [Rudaea sp.]|nr:FKBP-type peptidyl-prolyl cis-trans isomerase [Rudaea sp.]